MSSFWQITSNTKKLKTVNNLNESLPFLNTSKIISKNKETSKTLHRILPDMPSKCNLIKKQNIKPQKKYKKQTLASINCKSLYRLPLNKIKIEENQLIQFADSIQKIEELFNQQCQILNLVQNNKFNPKKTLGGKSTFGKLNQIQILLETNPKKQIKKEFQEILRIYNKNLIRIPDNSIVSKQDQHGVQMRLTKNLTENVNKSIKKNDQNILTDWEKQQLFKKSKAFQKAEKHFILKTFTAKMFYHHLTAQLALQQVFLQDALISLYFCEYYARKIDLNSYIIPCLLLQSEIKHALYQFNSAINILKTALQFSVIHKWKDLQMRILQKISMIYYYRGNSYMAKYYKELSESGLPQYQAQIYIKQYSKSEELRSLEARLFSLPYEGMKKKKHNQRYEFDISRDLLQDHEKLINSHHQSVSEMLKNNETSKIGIRLRKMILQNNQKGKVKRFNHERHSTDILPRFVAFQYPFEHCSQILKSHLSKDRSIMHSQIKNVSFSKTLNTLKSLYQRVSYQVGKEKLQESVRQKENLPYANHN